MYTFQSHAHIELGGVPGSALLKKIDGVFRSSVKTWSIQAMLKGRPNEALSKIPEK